MTRKTDRLALWHLARWLEGIRDATAPLIIKVTWPATEKLLDNEAALARWLAGYSDLKAAVEAVDPHGPVPIDPLPVLSGRQILTTDWPEPEWIVPGILPVGLTMLAGKSKVGKSWLALQICKAVVTGGRTLGERVKSGRILYLALEDPERRIYDRMQKQRWPTDTPSDFLSLGKFKDTIANLTRGGGALLALQIESGEYDLTVIDTLSRATPGHDQNDVAAMTEALTPMQELAQRLNTAIVLVDHHNKSASGDVIADILGSTAKGAMCDTALGLYSDRGQARGRLAVVGRDVIEKNLAITFDPGMCMWESEGNADGLRITPKRQELLDVIEKLGESQAGPIAQVVGRDEANVYRELQGLRKAGLVVPRKDGRKVYYRKGDAFDAAMS